ncbi:MAG: hypothetical protein WCF36_00740 [Candidatus Nanopelagicales bacterium]
MADHKGKGERKLYTDWREAETRYAEALAAFGGDDPPAKIKKYSALELSKARNKADTARDKFFKQALK